MAEFQSVIDLSNLDAVNGFKINGEGQYDRLGISIASSGDINGDGFRDLVIGSDYSSYSPHDDNPSKSYVIFGSATGFGSPVEVSQLNGDNGFQITGERLVGIYSYSSNVVASGVDINGDGFNDIIIGDAYAGANSSNSYNTPGVSYVVYGHGGDFDPELSLSSLDGTNGFKLSGEEVSDAFGSSVALACDLNGDGIGDIIVGASQADLGGSNSGSTYVIFGSQAGLDANLQLSDLNGKNGFRIIGQAANDRSGCAVASAGDVNGDGFADVIIGAYGADANGSGSGAAYIVFGRDQGFATNLVLADLNGTNGFKISGEAAGDQVGGSVATAGDINADGFDDIIVGARLADPHGASSGASYVIFGKAGGFPANLQLTSLNGSNGFQINGEASEDWSGRSVASAGDVNGDGFGDLIIGASLSNANGTDSGAAYVVFGRASGFSANLQLSRLDGSNGFKIAGESFSDFLGGSVASAGDLDGDGFDDLIVGATGANPNGGSSGAAYVIYGHRAEEAVTRIGTSLDNTINGGKGDDVMRGLAGNDRLIAWEGDDTVFGNTGADFINGRSGNDLISGGGGRDVLIGGFGADVFDFNGIIDSGFTRDRRDIIRDFGLGNDRIDLSDLGTLAFIGTEGFSNKGQVQAVQQDDDTVLKINLTGDARPEMTILLRDVEAATLTADEFIL